MVVFKKDTQKSVLLRIIPFEDDRVYMNSSDVQ